MIRVVRSSKRARQGSYGISRQSKQAASSLSLGSLTLSLIVTLVDRGYISDEDTSIYNPGLTLLTESEKERLTSAIIASKKAAVNENQWSENNKFAFEFLRDKLDPFHTYELRGYLAVLPTLALVVYLGVMAVQQTARNL